MSTTKTIQTWSLASVALHDAYTDFMLSRQAMSAKKTTLEIYYFMVGKFLEWAELHGITSPEEITARYVREYIAELISRGKADTTVWNHARTIRTMFLFWNKEGYMPVLVRFELPKKAKKRQPRLNREQLERVLKACDIRDKAIVMFLADSGLRREEAVKLNWADVDMQTGRVTVKQGKGGKDRHTNRMRLISSKQLRSNSTTATIKTAVRQSMSEQSNNYPMAQCRS